MLTIKGVSYHVSSNRCLFDNVSLKIDNEIVGLSGNSGIGKTTLAKLIARIIPLETGSIHVEKSDAKSNPIQLIWQHPEQAVNPKWRIKRILLEAGEIDSDLLKKCGIKKDWLTRFPHQLSGGELQRVCIARCLISKPRVIIADEITTMLDGLSQVDIWELLIIYVKQNKVPMLVISHDEALLNRICDRMINFQKIVDLEKK
ncbi:ABC transporter ATP-binding protein [Saliterribacillus persicus]|uniref:Peptide/nickel transport system ATP-binding protein n=1 Tax=Saliterribacillus persicus TaxID=930114 RepID=A0A368Y9L1_9BACI|nr:ATP-binding cassette domain-containing protein [Saliterribacillus persicus]RCW74874.1 peptide/nickel transport system ATP-binding protein [Saliterribacillus persicus]